MSEKEGTPSEAHSPKCYIPLLPPTQRPVTNSQC